MIAIDSSAIVATILHEPEAQAFEKILVRETSVIGAPTLVETRIVLEGRLSDRAGIFLHRLIAERGITVVPFDPAMAETAADAFLRYGKGRGHPAGLNFGDCLSYAVASVMRLPLLFKGDDFVHTDIVPAYSPAP